MRAQVNAELCVGCGLCADVCPDVFAMQEDKAKVKTNPVPDTSLDCCKKSEEDCPVEAINIGE